MSTQLSPSYLLSNDEFLVRRYLCAEVKAFLSARSDAFLDITNKRVIYCSGRMTKKPKSKVLGEMPLEEVSGIDLRMSESVDFLQFFLFAAIAFVLNSLLGDLIPFVFDSLVFGLLLSLPFLIVLLFEHQLLNPALKERIKNQVYQSEMGALLQKDQNLAWPRIARYLFLIGASILIYKITQGNTFSGLGAFLRTPVLLLGYFLVYLLAFPRAKAFNLSIRSRSAGASSISIRTSLLKVVGDKFMAGSQGKLIPGKDAEELARELGALVMDLQQMGDLGVQKWISN